MGIGTWYLAYHFDADPDLDSTFQFDADPDPQHGGIIFKFFFVNFFHDR